MEIVLLCQLSHLSTVRSYLVDDLPEDGPGDVLVLTHLAEGQLWLAEPRSEAGQGRPVRTYQGHHVGLAGVSVYTDVGHHRSRLQHRLHLAQTDVPRQTQKS